MVGYIYFEFLTLRVFLWIHSPGLRGSHILRIGSEPPAATSAEPSPPTSTVLRAFPEYYNLTEKNWLQNSTETT